MRRGVPTRRCNALLSSTSRLGTAHCFPLPQFISPELNTSASSVLCCVKMLQASVQSCCAVLCCVKMLQASAGAPPAPAGGAAQPQHGHAVFGVLYTASKGACWPPLQQKGAIEPHTRFALSIQPTCHARRVLQCIDGSRASRRDSKRFFCSLKEVGWLLRPAPAVSW